MADARLIRTVRFRARHHYRRRAWTEEENRRVFGDQADPHEHDWTVDVHVAGPVDDGTGWAVDLPALDRALEATTAGWDGGDLNALVEPVAAGDMMPSTEAMARWIYETLAAQVPEPARLVRVRVAESPDLAAEYPA